jgi:membrane-bound metal-dependent hydrolase YbcI (DUF457 family)
MATTTAVPYRTSYTVKARSRAGEHEGDMEGTTHASTGFLLGAGVTLLATAAGAHGTPVADGIGRDLLYGALTAGFALLPDADHPKASFAYAAGPLSHGISHLVAVLFGGHRQGMHSLAGIGVVALAAESGAVWWPNRWALAGLAAFIAICVAAGLSATGFARRPGRALLAGCLLAGLAAAEPSVRPDLWWLAAMGMALHILEDLYTGHGTALAWPLTNRRYGGDRRQPAARRPARKRPAGSRGTSARRPSGSRPVSGRPPARRGPQVMCPSCWVGECDACKGQGCACPQPGTSHPNRVKRKPTAGPRSRPRIPPDPPMSRLSRRAPTAGHLAATPSPGAPLFLTLVK